MDLVITDVADATRYEARDGTALAGFVQYQLADGLVVVTHTEVDPAYEGRGVGGALARHVLDDIRRRDVSALVVCPFVTSWIGRHPEYADLLYGAKRQAAPPAPEA
ncbi:GNAT family N-acetyltransferase [Auraticoccus sp. F435]|uniref:GNAT family N-acetyltransferase n=2 Tax=Auraticoccus cholistanensis TaxID=2656650 RepID=A0A6A9URB3_9ACTN|nr:GNAT family N-acetyltransferase [Auraticoccus cholistanensis]MVA75201.1 GNAT family N-acetyltransferase [Auraticoccus cholistanensis]